MKISMQGTMAHKLCSEDPDLRCPEHDKMSFALALEATWPVLIKDAGILGPDDVYRLGRIHLEFPIVKGEGQYQVIVGFADALRVLETPGWDQENVIVEAKPKINNPMEVLRQINTYKRFLRGKYLLWCPSIDAVVSAVFESQNISVSGLTLDKLATS